jgi:hypothetical protein
MVVSPSWKRFVEIAVRTIPDGRVRVDGEILVECSSFVNGDLHIIETYWRENGVLPHGNIASDSIIVRLSEMDDTGIAGIAFAMYALLMQSCHPDRRDKDKVCIHQTSQLLYNLRLDRCLSRFEVECLVCDGLENANWDVVVKLGSAWLRMWNAAGKIADAWLRYRERRTFARCRTLLMCLRKLRLLDDRMNRMIEWEVLPRALKR